MNTKRKEIIDHLFESACGYGMAEEISTNCKYATNGKLMPGKIDGTVAGGKIAFTKCIEAIPDEYLEDFIYTLYRIAEKSGSEGFSY
jgi:hypothetical protein